MLRFLDWLLNGAFANGGGITVGTVVRLMAVQ